MDQQRQNSKKVDENMKILEDISRGLRDDAESSLVGTLDNLKKMRENMDVPTALAMKEELEKSGTSFETMTDELGKLRKATERNYS